MSDNINKFQIFHNLFNKLSPQLFSCENLLPTLPLPPLKQAISRYLDSIEPLLTPVSLCLILERNYSQLNIHLYSVKHAQEKNFCLSTVTTQI